MPSDIRSWSLSAGPCAHQSILCAWWILQWRAACLRTAAATHAAVRQADRLSEVLDSCRWPVLHSGAHRLQVQLAGTLRIHAASVPGVDSLFAV